MTPITWDEVVRMKVSYASDLGLERWKECRRMAKHLRLLEQFDQWLVALFCGTAFLLGALGVGLARANRAVPKLRDARVLQQLPAIGPLPAAGVRRTWFV